jgi:DNA-binding MurR/RpiR family transcriptional regulator
MPTQQQIAAHLDMDQSAVSRMLDKLGLRAASSLDEVRVAYIRQLRGQASGHRSEDGHDLVRERVLTERVDRELKQLQVAEKRGVLINVEQLEPEYMNMIGAFRSELLARDDKLATELLTLYGIEVDTTVLNEHTHNALAQLGRYDASDQSVAASADRRVGASGAPDDNGMGASAPGDIG